MPESLADFFGLCSDKQSEFQTTCTDQMTNYADLAENLVKRWADPVEAGEGVGTQIKRAYDRLRGWQMEAGWSKVRRAWYGEANEPTYRALLDQERHVRKSQQVDARMRAQFIQTLEQMRVVDAEFFYRQIEAYRAATGHGGGEGASADTEA